MNLFNSYYSTRKNIKNFENILKKKISARNIQENNLSEYHFNLSENQTELLKTNERLKKEVEELKELLKLSENKVKILNNVTNFQREENEKLNSIIKKLSKKIENIDLNFFNYSIPFVQKPESSQYSDEKTSIKISKQDNLKNDTILLNKSWDPRNKELEFEVDKLKFKFMINNEISNEYKIFGITSFSQIITNQRNETIYLQNYKYTITNGN